MIALPSLEAIAHLKPEESAIAFLANFLLEEILSGQNSQLVKILNA